MIYKYEPAPLSQAFASFRAAALQSSVTSRKMAAVGASFTRQQRQQLLRAALLNVVMQGTFTSELRVRFLFCGYGCLYLCLWHGSSQTLEPIWI